MELRLNRPADSESLRELRELTDCGMMVARDALAKRLGDMEFATEYVKRTGLAMNCSYAARYPEWFSYLKENYAFWWLDLPDEARFIDIESLPSYLQEQLHKTSFNVVGAHKVVSHPLMPYLEWENFFPALDKFSFLKSKIVLTLTKVNVGYIKNQPGYITDIELNRFPWVDPEVKTV